MKTFKAFLFAVVLACFAVPSAYSQSIPTTTTIATAMLGGAANNQITVTSATGILASTSGLQQFCLIGHEIVQVRSIASTVLTVNRGVGGQATPHKALDTIICGAGGGGFNPTSGNTTGVFIGVNAPSGACTASGNQFLPVVGGGGPNSQLYLYNCNAGEWAEQTLPDDRLDTIKRYCAPPFLGVLTVLTTFGSTPAPIQLGVNKTPVANTWYYGSIEVPYTKLLTGASILNGLTAATDTLIYALLRADGTKVANTLATGTTASGAGTFQDIAFTATYLATGPARYWVAVLPSGNTTRLATIGVTPGVTTAGLGGWVGMLGSSFVSTALTIPTNFASVTISGAGAAAHVTAMPTTLIDQVAPISCVY